jgi:hypothetical protein
MVYFQIKNNNLGKFWTFLDRQILMYFMAIGNILQTFGILYDNLLYFVFNWYIISDFGIMHQKNLATLMSIGSWLISGSIQSKSFPQGGEQICQILRLAIISSQCDRIVRNLQFFCTFKPNVFQHF